MLWYMILYQQQVLQLIVSEALRGVRKCNQDFVVYDCFLHRVFIVLQGPQLLELELKGGI